MRRDRQNEERVLVEGEDRQKQAERQAADGLSVLMLTAPIRHSMSHTAFAPRSRSGLIAAPLCSFIRDPHGVISIHDPERDLTLDLYVNCPAKSHQMMSLTVSSSHIPSDTQSHH